MPLPFRIAILFFCYLASLNSVSFAKETLVLTSSQVKEVSLTSTIDIQTAKLDQQIAKQDIPAAYSVYDPALKIETSYALDKSQRSNPFTGTESRSRSLSIELGQKTPIGTEISVGLASQRDSSDSAFATVNPAHDSRVEIGLKQPLTQNMFGLTTRKQIAYTKKLVSALDQATQANIQAKMLANLKAYWNFYAAYQNKALEREAYHKALELLKTNKKKKNIGLIENSDLYAFKSNVNIREASLYEAQDRLTTTSEELRWALNLEPHLLLKAGKESFKSPPKPKLDDTLKKALNQRPDYLAVKDELEAQNLKLVMTRNALLPQLDLTASLVLNGVSQDYATALGNIGDGHPIWTAGLELNFPLLNRYNRSEHQKEKLGKAKKILELKKKEREVTKDATIAVKQYSAMAARMRAAVNARHHQYQKLKGELKKYEQGRSDSDTVIRFHNDYINAKKLAVKARVDFKVAQIHLKYAQGQILE